MGSPWRSGVRHHLRGELPEAAGQRSCPAPRHRRLDDRGRLRPDPRTARPRPDAARALHGGADRCARGAQTAPFASSRRTERGRVVRPDRGRALHRQPAPLVRSVEEDQGAVAYGARWVVAGELMFIDRAVVRVTAGTGGSGASSFARFKYKPKGGPDGGDGGHGGSVYVRGAANLATLLDYRYRTEWKAGRGEHGKGKTQTGASADDLYLPVPPGTIVRDADTGQPIGEVLREGDTLLVAQGGRGGRGNARFATSTHQAPREWEPGEEGQDRQIELALKLIADVGLLGEPNAGKSTLLSVVSAARPKIADYPFTTLEPNLGVVALSGHRTFVMADIPGIIEGAHQGKGLGLKFLQHVERTRVMAYLVPLDAPDPQQVYQRLRDEVRRYNEALAETPHVLLLTKRDLLPTADQLPAVAAPEAAGVLAISSASGAGLDEVKEFLWKFVEAAKAVGGEAGESAEIVADAPGYWEFMDDE